MGAVTGVGVGVLRNVRETSIVSFLMCPFCVRDELTVETTRRLCASIGCEDTSLPSATRWVRPASRTSRSLVYFSNPEKNIEGQQHQALLRDVGQRPQSRSRQRQGVERQAINDGLATRGCPALI
jgi:hypothetical protein